MATSRYANTLRRIMPLLLALSANLSIQAAEPAAPGPVMGQAADWLPKDCVIVVQTDFKGLREHFGATAFARFMSETDTQAFFARPLQRLGDAYGRWRERFPVMPGIDACAQLSSGDLAFGLRLLPPATPQEPPRPAPLVVLRLKDPQAAQAALAAFIEPLPRVKLESGLEARGGEGLYLALAGDWLLAAGELDSLNLLAGAAVKKEAQFTATPRWSNLAALLGTGLHAVAWADLQPVRKHLLQLPDDPDARAALPPSPAKALAALGLDGVQSLAVGLGIAGAGFDYRLALESPPAARRGLIKLIEGEGPLQAGMLNAVPANAGWFYATRMDLRRILPLLRDGMEAAEGARGPGQSLGMYLLAFRLLTGVDLEKDLLASLGDQWVVCDSGGGGALLDLLPGLTVTGQVKDPARAEPALKALLLQMARNAPRDLDARCENAILEGVSVHYLSLTLTDVSPSFAVVGKQVVFAPTVSSLRRQLRHLTGLPNARDIRSQPQFQAACRQAFGAALPEAGAPDADAAPLPGTLRYLDPQRAQPTRLLGSIFGLGNAFGPELLERLRGEEGLRRARLLSALRLLGDCLPKFKPKEGEAARNLPADPRELLNQAGGNAALATDLGGVHFFAGLNTGDAPATIVAYAHLDPAPGTPYTVVRLDGSSATLDAAAAMQELATQAAAFKAAQRTVAPRMGTPSNLVRTSAWWLKAWGLQEEERSLLTIDLLQGLRSFDFALLPDIRRFEAGLQPGLSWTRSTDQGIVSRTLSSYPLPAADLAGGAVPLLLASAVVPEIFKGRKANNESSARADLGAIAGAQDLYKLADWDGDGTHAYADSLAELHARGLLDGRIAGAEAREGAFPAAKSGYLFRVLPAQGKAAPGGEKNYIANKQWTQGFAVLAWPAEYGRSGSQTYMVGPDGRIWEADHGTFTQAVSKNLQVFDPDPQQGWRKAE